MLFSLIEIKICAPLALAHASRQAALFEPKNDSTPVPRDTNSGTVVLSLESCGERILGQADRM